ncbi:MAG: hypothetical protein ACXU9O_11125 [Gemmatimonadaceae bacterium]
MINRKDRSPLAGDVARSHPTVADQIGDELGGEPLIIRLGDLWSDLVHAAGGSRNTESPRNSSSAVPLLDEMKGILHWD